jgi:hypothetical protein
MKSSLIGALVLVVAASAFARPPVQHPTPVDPNPPTVTACIAYGYLNQRCQKCLHEMDPHGYEVGTCYYTTAKSGCACTWNTTEAVGCVDVQGVCTYY